jgi:hypothetical protein
LLFQTNTFNITGISQPKIAKQAGWPIRLFARLNAQKQKPRNDLRQGMQLVVSWIFAFWVLSSLVEFCWLVSMISNFGEFC